MRNGDSIIHEGSPCRIGHYVKLVTPIPVKGRKNLMVVGSGRLFDLGTDLGEVLEYSDGSHEVKAKKK